MKQNTKQGKFKKLKGFKQNLASKDCLECGRPFQYRKKWKNCWDNVKYCSQKCKNQAKKKLAKTKNKI
jgi:hypothetical protein